MTSISTSLPIRSFRPGSASRCPIPAAYHRSTATPGPTHPDVQGLAGAVRLIQHDRSEFFALLAGADHDNVDELIREHDGLHSRDVWALLQVPLLTLLDQRDPS